MLDKNIYEAFLAESSLGLYDTTNHTYTWKCLLIKAGRLPSKATSTYGPVPIEFWFEMENLDLSLEPNAPSIPGDRQLIGSRLFERAYECLGSVANDQVFMILDEEVNQAKNFVGPFSCLHSYPLFRRLDH